MEVKVYSQDGKETGKIALPEAVFNVAWNADLVHEVVVSMRSNARAGTADTKGRGEVRGGGKKPWKQKGTGRARHGSRRSPIWKGGGVAHGPLAEKDYSKKINRNARAKALAAVFSKKHAEGEIIFVDTFNFAEPKTKLAKDVIVSLAGIKGNEYLKSKRKNNALVVLPARNESVEKSFQNFGNIGLSHAKDINPVELLTYKYVIVTEPKEAFETLLRRVATKQARKVKTA